MSVFELNQTVVPTLRRRQQRHNGAKLAVRNEQTPTTRPPCPWQCCCLLCLCVLSCCHQIRVLCYWSPSATHSRRRVIKQTNTQVTLTGFDVSTSREMQVPPTLLPGLQQQDLVKKLSVCSQQKVALEVRICIVFMFQGSLRRQFFLSYISFLWNCSTRLFQKLTKNYTYLLH